MCAVVGIDAFGSVMGERRGRPAQKFLSDADRAVIAAFLAGKLIDGDALQGRAGNAPRTGLLLCEGRRLAAFSGRSLLLETGGGSAAWREADAELRRFGSLLGASAGPVA